MVAWILPTLLGVAGHWPGGGVVPGVSKVQAPAVGGSEHSGSPACRLRMAALGSRKAAEAGAGSRTEGVHSAQCVLRCKVLFFFKWQ